MSRTFGGTLAFAAVLMIVSAQAAWCQQSTRGLSGDSSSPNVTAVGDSRSNDDHWNDNRSNTGSTNSSDSGNAAADSNGQSQKSQSSRSSAGMTKAQRAAKAQQMRDEQRIARAKAIVNRVMNGEQGYGSQGNYGGYGGYGGYSGNFNGSNIGQMLGGQGTPGR